MMGVLLVDVVSRRSEHGGTIGRTEPNDWASSHGQREHAGQSTERVRGKVGGTAQRSDMLSMRPLGWRVALVLGESASGVCDGSVVRTVTVVELEGAASPGRFVEFVDRTPLLAGGKPVLDVGDGPCLALAGGVVVGKPSER
jgi:hypothetical protein